MKKITFLSIVLLVSLSFNRAKATPIHAVIDTVENECCNGGSNGFITVTPSGGTAPYTYSWTPSGETDSTATGLAVGTYTVIVTDALGQTASASATITQPTVLIATPLVPVNNTTCVNPNGSAAISAMGGVMPYTYLWMPSGQTRDTAKRLVAATYTCNVMDNNGCTFTSAITVGGTAGPIVTVHSTADTNLCDGTATATVSGGVSPYTYKWSPGGQTTSSLTGLCAGIYCCKVTDHSGCTDSNFVKIDTNRNVCCPCGSIRRSSAAIKLVSIQSSDVDVYPNPSNGMFTLTYSMTKGDNVEISIINELGQVVYSEQKRINTGANTEQLNIENLASGIYSLRIQTSNGILVRKLLIMSNK